MNQICRGHHFVYYTTSKCCKITQRFHCCSQDDLQRNTGKGCPFLPVNFSSTMAPHSSFCYLRDRERQQFCGVTFSTRHKRSEKGKFPKVVFRDLVHKAYQNILYFQSVTLVRFIIKLQSLCPGFQNSKMLKSISEFQPNRTGNKELKGKTIPLQAWTGRQGSRRLRLPEFLHSRHMKVVRQSAIRIGRIYVPGDIPGTRFCYRLSLPQGHIAVCRIKSLKNPDRTRNLPVAQYLHQLLHRFTPKYRNCRQKFPLI